MYKEKLIDEIVDTTIDSIDDHMRDYVEELQPELIGKGEFDSHTTTNKNRNYDQK